ncbi:MAG: hypothetical protein HY355_06735 [Armatimonadetes bacterium]|nr:hypothetical protein [Armatimonadota bacterium]
MLEDLMNRIGQVHERATVKTVFGEPFQVNGRTIIPVAKVAYGFGFGAGRSNEREKEEEETGEGGGGGGGVSVRPVAVLEISGQDTKVKPIVDVTRLALAGMVLAAWNVFWIAYTIRKMARGRG